ncbi:AzlD domain-containing protein [Thalassotalea euphylliae]|uniref:AzlD domain-containing protein n=1 Tax=Thalassotalea euphylliae TaxID=1655234 RepID=A0A3E0TV59_9GAMM|nr:AzlD domain-containing protein [Thalassotalea euphylliae]REL28478.1 AzlD domain-containing protein [Thalassotalea euphylliae]
MNEVLLILGMFVVTFGIRYVLFAVADNIEFPDKLKRALNYVPIAVLTAIIFPAVFMPKGELFVSTDNPYIVGAIVAVVISFWRKNMLLTVVTGLVAFAAWKWLLIG